MFLDFISYSDGPLPDDLLAACTKPVSILWGEKDPWEPIADGRKFQRHSCVEEFIDLPGVRPLVLYGAECVSHIWVSEDQRCA